jgi:hypothetical protein
LTFIKQLPGAYALRCHAGIYPHGIASQETFSKSHTGVTAATRNFEKRYFRYYNPKGIMPLTSFSTL